MVVGDDFSPESLAELRQMLLVRRRFDLGMYKDPCIRRRIAKRLRALKIADLRSYLVLLRHDSGELDALMASLSIHVSQFFRNPSTFMALEQTILPDLIDRCQAAGHRQLLVWSVGCAGGEEPYSLALLFDEMAPELDVSILATDLSPDILIQARQGLFDPLRLSEISPEVRQRYFLPEARNFRLDPAICRRVRFEQHNILSAAPYPGADLILCRNVLIYFSRREQESILCRFAAALREGGVLVLGKAETLLGEARRWFQIENQTERIYRKQTEPAPRP